MPDFNYPKILDLFPEHLDPNRNESASFLIWYLENYYRLDQQEAVDSVCDQKGDKGVDGIFVNDNDETITIFQSKISQKTSTTIGDVSLKEFFGTISQFTDAASISHLIETSANTHVAALVKRLDLVNKIATHELRGEFITNIDIDQNGKNYLAKIQQITFLGKSELNDTYISNTRDLPVHGPVSFDVSDFSTSQYFVDADTQAIIAPIKAKELVTLKGISDQSIFAYNVRGPLGNTRVNKSIVASLRKKEWHKAFPLFHNGITIIAKELKVDDKTITAEDYFVVNGCQSLTAINSNQSTLTDDLRLLVKFVKMDPRSDAAKMITDFSNNQNSIKSRDSKANNRIQIRLAKEMEKHYAGQYYYEIKRGDIEPGGTKISNESAGLYLRAFDLREPWATHRQYEVFEDRHADIFGRPEVTADRIVMLQTIMEAISDGVGDIDNTLFGKYLLTKFFLLYVIRVILASSELKDDILRTPEKFVRDKGNRAHFKSCIKELLGDIIIDVNGEVDELGAAFDYRDKLRDQEWVKKISDKIVREHKVRVKRKRISSFAEEWEKRSNN